MVCIHPVSRGINNGHPDGEIEHISAVTLEQHNQSSKTDGRTEISTGDERRAGVPTYSLKTKRKQTGTARNEWRRG